MVAGLYQDLYEARVDRLIFFLSLSPRSTPSGLNTVRRVHAALQPSLRKDFLSCSGKKKSPRIENAIELYSVKALEKK